MSSLQCLRARKSRRVTSIRASSDPEVPKPPELAKRGGVWFENRFLKIHLGVENDFHPARKAHPALLVEDLNSLVALLREKGFVVVDDDALGGFFRVYVSDPFGNRIELMEHLK